MNTDQIELTLIEHGFPIGRMISFSKSGYHQKHPDGQPVFNANIVHKEHGKVWHGDLDVSLDSEKLQQVATIIGEFSVLREMDCRFDTEGKSYEYYKEKAVKTFE